jgi:hypothetical protein
MLTCALVLSPVSATTQQHDERAVRAAYVFNLIKYVEWPEGHGDLLIEYIGEPATGETLQKMLDGKTSDSRTIHVLLAPHEDELAKCSIVYIADRKVSEIHKELDRLKGKKILTLGETETFTEDGGMVGLVKVDDHIQIQVNLEAAQRAGVKISSRVLSLAQIVRPAQGARN